MMHIDIGPDQLMRKKEKDQKAKLIIRRSIKFKKIFCNLGENLPISHGSFTLFCWKNFFTNTPRGGKTKA